jgi:hypothetical protein
MKSIRTTSLSLVTDAAGLRYIIVILSLVLGLLQPGVKVKAASLAEQEAAAFVEELTAAVPLAGAYGISGQVGPKREPCEQGANKTGLVIVAPTDAWAKTLSTTAKAGDTILLRAGVYDAGGVLSIGAGAAGRPITIKPYNCEAVTLRGEVRPRSYNILAGLRIESNQKWAIRIGGKGEAHVDSVIIRNNTILGGTTDAIRVLDDTANIEISYNVIDGGAYGHNIFVTAEQQKLLPDQILITQNLLTKQFYKTAGEDMFQARDIRRVAFLYNTCSMGLNMEQCVDIKSAVTPLLISHNFFDGDNMHLSGNGEDGSGGCMVIHEYDGKPEQHVIEENLFKNCKGTLIRFATGGAYEISSGLVRRNVFITPAGRQDNLAIVRGQNVTLDHNTMLNGVLRFGNSSGSPTGTLLKDNIFYNIGFKNLGGSAVVAAQVAAPTVAQTVVQEEQEVFLDDAAEALSEVEPAQANSADGLLATEAAAFGCSNNLFYKGSVSALISACASSLSSDPLFMNLASNDYRLQPQSPARSHASDGSDLGAFAKDLPANPIAVGAGSTPVERPTELASVFVYLPLVGR